MRTSTEARERWLWAVIAVAYMLVGIAYALATPAWQAPDEPAHYNYVRSLAVERQLPVLRLGDYDQAYLEEIKARRFPPEMSIDSIRYESHQPPLYYALMVPLYWMSGGSLTTLRLAGVFLGVCLLWVVWRLLWVAVPQRHDLAMMATAIVAFLPQHVAMTAAVNNDGLANLILVGAMLYAVACLRGGVSGRRQLMIWGGLIGLGFLTKATAYLAWPLALLAVLLQREGNWRRRLGQVMTVSLPALLLGAPWWVRNSLIYGGWDILGLRWHDVVVTGQPRTVDWVHQYGVIGLLQRGLQTTFRSFWGQFGWMGVLMDSRIYLALAIVTATALAGALIGLVIWLRRTRGSDRVGWMMMAWAGAVVATYLWYNLTFVQHQGRYLFPALPVWALVLALGLDQALRRPVSWWMGAGWWMCAALGGAWTWWRGALDKWFVLMAGLAAPGAWVAGLDVRLRRLAMVGICVGLWLLDWVALRAFIVPQLAGGSM